MQFEGQPPKEQAPTKAEVEGFIADQAAKAATIKAAKSSKRKAANPSQPSLGV